MQTKNAGILVITLLVCSVLGSSAHAQISIAGELANAMEKYRQTRFDDGIAIARSLLDRPNLKTQDSIAVYEVICVCTYGKGDEYRAEAYSYLARINELGPCVIPLPHKFWPRRLQDQWYRSAHARNTLTCPREYDGTARTIAVMPFDNLSIGDYYDRNKSLGSALSEFFLYKFAAFSDLEIVERNKLDYLIREITGIKDSLIDAATAVQIGKMLGAHLMVFGSISQFDDDNARLLVRVVDVETSKILTMVSEEGEPKFSKMVTEAVEELAENLQLELDKEREDRLKQGGTDSMDALQLYTQGLEYMDKYDYSKAYEFFTRAYEADDEFIQAKEKLDIYKPLVL